MRYRLVAAAWLLVGCPSEPEPTEPKPAASKPSGAQKPPEPKKAAACDRDRIKALASKLDDGGPRTRAATVAMSLGKACTLPGFVSMKLAVATGFAYTDETKPPRPDASQWKQAYERACPGSHEVVTSVAHSEQEGRAAKLFDGCDFGRFDIVEREVFAARPSASPLPFIVFQWLVDDGVEAAYARSIGRALELLDRRHRGVVRRDSGIEVPQADASLPAVPRWPKLEVSPSAVRLGNKNLARLDAGRLDPAAVVAHTVTALSQALDSNNNRPEDAGLLLVADARTPFATMADVLHTAQGKGLDRFALVADTGVYQYGSVPIRVMAPRKRGAVPPTVRIEIDEGGFAITHSTTLEAAPERIEGHAVASLTAKLDAHLDGSSTSPRVTLVPHAAVTLDTVARTIAALRTLQCPDGNECSIPILELSRAWLP